MFEISLAGAIALKTTCLLLAAGFAAWALAKRTSALRHALWIGALLLSAFMPIAVLTLPSLAIIPASWMPPETLEVPLGGTSPNAISTLEVWSVASKLWLSGAMILLIRLVISQASLIRWRLKARLLRSGAWAETLQYVSSHWRISRTLRVLESPAVVNPCTWGFFRPVLLLPADGVAWTETERRLALIHELAHIRRNDFLTTILARFACAVHWYNPLVWLAARETRILQEQACDDAVLRTGATASDYASFLRRAAESAQCGSSRLAAAMGVAGHSELRERVDSILDPARPRTPLSSAPALGIWMVIACLAIFLAAAVPQSPAQLLDSIPLQSRLAEDEAPGGEEPLEVDEADELPTMPDTPAPSEPAPAVPPVPPVSPVPAVPPVPPILPTPPDEPSRGAR